MTVEVPPPLPREHVRRPDLPWRTSTMTECGRPTNDVGVVIDRDALIAKIKRDGVQRAAYTTCMTCMETARRWPLWSEDPVRALSREFYGGRADPRFVGELRALAALVEEHRDEFDGYVEGLAETVSLDQVRRARARRVTLGPN